MVVVVVRKRGQNLNSGLLEEGPVRRSSCLEDHERQAIGKAK